MTTPQISGEGGVRLLGPVGTDEEVVAFVRGRSVPCPRCGYELKDLERAQCPECGEPLILRIGTPRMRFGWLVLAMAPGCFSGVAAFILFWPMAYSIYLNLGGNRGMPIPLQCAVMFGFLSAASVGLIYRERHRIIAWRTKRQVWFACGVWGVHLLAFAAMLGAMLLFY